MIAYASTIANVSDTNPFKQAGVARLQPRSLRGMSLILIGLFAIAFVVLSGAIWAEILSRREFQYLIETNSLPADHQSIHDRDELFKWLQAGAFLPAAAMFILWFHRAYSNLARIGISRLRWGSTWAIGAWFVPFLNFVRPAALAKDIWLGSDPDLPYESPLPSGRMTWLLGSWWLAFVVSLYGSRTCNVLSRVGSPPTQESFETGVIAFDVLGLVATVLAIVVVYKIWQREDTRSAIRTDAASPSSTFPPLTGHTRVRASGQEPLLVTPSSTMTSNGAQSLYPSIRSIGQRFVVVVVALTSVVIFHGGGLLMLCLIVLAILTLGMAKRRIDLGESAITVVPLFPLRRKRVVLWSSIGPFTQTRERSFIVLKAPLLHPAPHGFIAITGTDGFSLQAVYGHGWLNAPLPADQLAKLFESYRTSLSATASRSF